VTDPPELTRLAGPRREVEHEIAHAADGVLDVGGGGEIVGVD
jgi:hypothetical protein